MPADSARPDAITVMCVEDHPVFRVGLRTIIESQDDMRLVAQVTTAADAIESYRQHQPDVTLMDVRLTGSDGIDALARIRQEFLRARSYAHFHVVVPGNKTYPQSLEELKKKKYKE